MGKHTDKPKKPERFRITADMVRPSTATVRRPAQDFLLQHIDYDQDDCLIWPLSRFRFGYGRIALGGQVTYAHRVMCVLAHGEPLKLELEAAHTCGKGHLGCVNPRHLAWKTSAQNKADMVIHGTRQQGAKHYKAKLTAEQVAALREWRPTKRGDVVRLAKSLGMSHSSVSRLRSGQGYRSEVAK